LYLMGVTICPQIGKRFRRVEVSDFQLACYYLFTVLNSGPLVCHGRPYQLLNSCFTMVHIRSVACTVEWYLSICLYSTAHQCSVLFFSCPRFGGRPPHVGPGAVSKGVSVKVSDKFMKCQNQNRPTPFPGQRL